MARATAAAAATHCARTPPGTSGSGSFSRDVATGASSRSAASTPTALHRSGRYTAALHRTLHLVSLLSCSAMGTTCSMTHSASKASAIGTAA
eukprot:scaffold69_cov248-Pinguiococcus_pyrenoidosus.AAC.10